MEPGHEDREYVRSAAARLGDLLPQWSPVMKTGNTRDTAELLLDGRPASMEPGHEDREYAALLRRIAGEIEPQWSPVMKTGNTPPPVRAPRRSQEPQWSPVMKTGNTRRR